MFGFTKKISKKKIYITVFFLFFYAFLPLGSAQESDFRASIRAGIELDGNVERKQSKGNTGFLTRYFGTIHSANSPFDNAAIIFDAKHGGKFFLEDQYAGVDTLITQLRLSFQHRILKSTEKQPGFFYDFTLNMKDKTERISQRDYNRAGAGAGMNLSLGDLRLRLGGTYRYFAFKPDPGSSSSNREGNASLYWALNESISLSATYTYARRAFETERFKNIVDEIKIEEGQLRQDNFHSFFIQSKYEGKVVGKLGYNLAINFSNSFGQELVRHTLTGSITSPLILDFFGTLKVELQRTIYEDPVRIDAAFIVDEDNRNSLVASLARDLGERMELELRYSLFLQEFGVGSDYQRQTLFFAFAYLYD